MKPRTTILLTLTVLATLLIGAFAVTEVFSPPKELKIHPVWKPDTITLDGYVPDPWYAEMFFSPPRPVEEVDPSTILLEGMYGPSGPVVHHPKKERLIVPFYGYDVLTALLTKAPHMQPGTFMVYLEVTGRLYSGQTFRGSGYINMTVPEYPPP